MILSKISKKSAQFGIIVIIRLHKIYFRKNFQKLKIKFFENYKIFKKYFLFEKI